MAIAAVMAAAAPAWAGVQTLAGSLASATNVVGQSINRLTNDSQAKAKSYLEKGRIALRQGNTVAATSWYQKALAAGGNFSPSQYSPRDLADELRQRGVDVARLRPASRFPQSTMQPGQQPQSQADRLLQGSPSSGNRIQRSPFAVRAQDDPYALGAENDPIERVQNRPRGSAFVPPPVPGGSLPAPSRSFAPPPVSGGSFAPLPPTGGSALRAAGNRPQSSQAMLLEARRALAGGDTRKAAQLAEQAKQSGGNFAPHEDSPAKVEDLIQRHKQIMATAGTGDRQRHAKSHAKLLVEQADGLLRHGDKQSAKRLAQQAQSLPAQFQPYEQTPGKILQRISGGAGATSQLPSSVPATSGGSDLAQVRSLMSKARFALDAGKLEEAQQLVRQAEGIDVPYNAFDGNETRPWKLRAEIERAIQRRKSVAWAGFEQRPPAASGGPAGGRFPGSQSVFRPERDTTQNARVSLQQPTPARRAPPINTNSGADELVQQGFAALRQGNRDGAYRLFQQAWERRNELDPGQVQRLQDQLMQLGGRRAVAEPVGPARQPSPLSDAEQKQLVLQEKIRREIITEQSLADRMQQQNPIGALQKLQNLRDRVAQSQLDPEARKTMLTLVDRAIGRTQAYIEEHRADIENDERNAAVIDEINSRRRMTLEVQNKLALLVDEFNELMEQRRYPEAEYRAKQARELAPDEAVVQNMIWQSKFVRRIAQDESIRERSEAGVVGALGAVDESSIPFDDREPWQLGDPRRWEELSRTRRRWMEQYRQPLTERERAIQQSLTKQVSVTFTNRPLSEVVALLGRMAKVNIHLDQQGLAAEGVTSATPVTINLEQEISLKSALNLILQPLHLSYIIQNDVLHVTSEQTRQSDVFAKVYNVADLVIPIPNFVPSYEIGLPGAIRQAHYDVGYGGAAPTAGVGTPLTVATNEAPANTNSSVLAQMGGAAPLGGGQRMPQQLGFGPGGVGGGNQADFDPLVELITSTISPDTWDEVGGPGSISGFEGNLSLVISQTQEVHEQIADLLEQLRRLQDLQVTIEVRFITLNDDFFERIGVDFDFDIDDQSNLVGDGAGGFVDPPGPPSDEGGPTTFIGLTPTGDPTGDLDLSFTQDSFGSALPQFGGFDAMTAANFGFAILSDIEVFFLLQAAQGDQRSNILQAPKVTLFNGQQAFVSDTSQTPFVTSIIPVVGDFAAAHQPVIVVLSEGTSLSVQAVVSQDRRFVRLTLVPFFSKIDSVQEFTFQGKTTTDSGSLLTDPTGTRVIGSSNVMSSSEGSTVQLPTFSFTTVTTTVSVPDGGTVLLGGIKRLSEGRTERGVPILDKLPYINRLFKNVGIGRTTQSLMMMVTPRIIIQEEEEEKAVGRPLS